jgi:hypothetical protein
LYTPGVTVTLALHNFAPGETYALSLSGLATPLAALRVSASGTLMTRFTIPVNAGFGLHTLTVFGLHSMRSVVFSISLASR